MSGRGAFNIVGKIVAGTATEADKRRLEHLNCDQARRMKRHDALSPIERLMRQPGTLAKSPYQIEIMLRKMKDEE